MVSGSFHAAAAAATVLLGRSVLSMLSETND